MPRFLFMLFCCLVASRTGAHPHVFVDVALRFEADAAGHLSGVEVTWSYDAFFSLLVLAERGLDADGDMVLTPEEEDALAGFDLEHWPEGFEGALFLESAGADIPLGAPESVSATIEDGRIVTRHRRLFGPVGGSVAVRPYDPYYYAALDLVGPVGLPAGCRAEIIDADTDAADAAVAALDAPAGEALFETAKVGIHYADTLLIRCAASS